MLAMFIVCIVSTGLAAYYIGFNRGYSSACNEIMDLSNRINQTLKLKSELVNGRVQEEYNKDKLN